MNQIQHFLRNCLLFINHILNLVLELFLLLECLSIIIAFISCQKLEQHLIWSAVIQTDEYEAEAPFKNSVFILLTKTLICRL